METMETNAKIREKIIPFSESGMRQFENVNDAVRYFQGKDKQPRSRKSIVWLWQQSFEINAGSVSVLVFDYKKPDQMLKRLEKLFKSETQQKLFENNLRIWIEKTKGINRIPTSDLNRIIAETKSLEK
jgi:hypothetical protein